MSDRDSREGVNTINVFLSTDTGDQLRGDFGKGTAPRLDCPGQVLPGMGGAWPPGGVARRRGGAKRGQPGRGALSAPGGDGGGRGLAGFL